MEKPACVLKCDTPFRDDADIRELVEKMEACQLPYACWSHRAHLAIALSYLRDLPFETALQRMRASIQRYNRSSGGDPNGYHETITVFYMKLLARELQRAGNIESLAILVNELCTSTASKEAPLRYYSSTVLWSPAARTGWVEPDLQALE